MTVIETAAAVHVLKEQLRGIQDNLIAYMWTCTSLDLSVLSFCHARIHSNLEITIIPWYVLCIFCNTAPHAITGTKLYPSILGTNRFYSNVRSRNLYI